GSTIRETKELFLNAEYIRKFFSSKSDQKKLLELYKKIRNIYQNNYTRYVHGGIANPGLLLADVHKEIVKEDKGFLDFYNSFVNAIHKQGMLHQLANSEQEDVWWVDNGKMDLINEYLKDKNYE